MAIHNLFSNIPRQLADEIVETLAENRHIRVERIVSFGQASPLGFWYDQKQAEWVVVLCGAAKLRFEGDAEPLHLQSGDYVNIPAHRKHRVEWTTPDAPTVWLAVFYSDESTSPRCS